MAATLFVNTWNGATSATPVQLISASRWQYLRVTNTGTVLLYVTTDGVVSVSGLTLTGNTTPAAGVDLGWTAGAGETIIVPSRQAFWWQGFGGPNGSIDGVGLDNFTSRDPPQHATTVTSPDPRIGTTLVAASASTAVVEGAG